MPMFSIIFLKFILANMSLHGISNFIGEFSILVGAFQRNSLLTTLAALGMILGVAYSLWLYNRVIFENFKPKFFQKISDLNKFKFFFFYLLLSKLSGWVFTLKCS
jgi:NADH-ubiquinone oxidoreductase chain 4